METARRSGPSKPRRGESPGPSASAWRENLESLVWAVAVALAIRTFIVAPFKIPSGSMHPTLIEGDRILVNRFLYRFHPPERGDIIVFRFPVDRKRSFIKRLVALGGDTVEIRQGKLIVNGKPLDTRGIFERTYYHNGEPFAPEGHPTEVPEGSYFVLGDNSASSHDSRFWGFVPKQFLVGKAMCIFWPITRWRILR